MNNNNNNHRVPDLKIEMEEQDYPNRQKKPSISMADDDIMELLWQNGQVVMHTQNHRPTRNNHNHALLPSPPRNSANHILASPSTTRELETYNSNPLFMQEDEMISLLHPPIITDPPLDQTFSSDFLYTPANTTTINANHSTTAMHTPTRTSSITDLSQFSPRMTAPLPPIPPPRRPDKQPAVATDTPNFACFAKRSHATGEAAAAPGPSSKLKKAIAPREQITVVESCDTPFASTSRVSENAMRFSEGDGGRGSLSGAGEAGPSTTAFDLTMTSSPGGSCSSGEPFQRAAAEDRKRKGRATEDWECQSQDVDFELAEAINQARAGSASTRRSRAAEVHNLSERRRRDRINEKMKNLQDLIPHSNKSDKASMLDEAIEYLKSLQLQVQMMSMGCGMLPMMFPGIQQYMPAMGMGIGMGMGMEMGMGMNMNMNMNRPVMPFPNMLAGSAAAAPPHLGPRFPMPPFPTMPHHVPSAPNTRMQQAANQSDNSNLPSLVATPLPDPNHSRIPNFTDPYQQYLGHGPHQMQMQFQLMQNQAVNQPNNASKPSTGSGSETHHQPAEK